MAPRISAPPCLAATLLLLLGLSVPGHAQRPGQENFISRAAFGDGRLWLLTDAGDLSSITPGEKLRVDARLPGSVLDICVTSGAIRALACSSPSCSQWAFYTSTDGDEWSLGTTIPSNGDQIIALDCSNTQETVVTNRRLIMVGGDTIASIALSDPLPSRAVTTAHGTVESVFVGVNAGEFGGGLRRIDRRTGVVASIQRNSTGDLCGGPLNPECDPVTGITDIPWKPTCVAAAIGLVHFSPHGRIVEVCGEDVQRAYFKPFEPSDPQPEARGDDEPFQTVAFFGLVRAGSDLLAPGIDGLYRFNGWEHPKIIPLPEFEAVGNVGVSFDLPDIILVPTAVNRRRSISGNVPLLVPR